MGGRMSRNKGSRVERLLRDLLRGCGYTADRIPLSGAAQGFKGDVQFAKDGKYYVAEVKARKDAFRRIYDLWSEHKLQTDTDTLKFLSGKWLVNVSSHPGEALSDGGTYPLDTNLPMYTEFKLTIRKIINLQKLVKDCDVLAIKDNHCPFLFIRFKEL
jgi:hypothetical protein